MLSLQSRAAKYFVSPKFGQRFASFQKARVLRLVEWVVSSVPNKMGSEAAPGSNLTAFHVVPGPCRETPVAPNPSRQAQVRSPRNSALERQVRVQVRVQV